MVDHEANNVVIYYTSPFVRSDLAIFICETKHDEKWNTSAASKSKAFDAVHTNDIFTR